MAFERLDPNDGLVLRYARSFFTINPGQVLTRQKLATEIGLPEVDVREALDSLLAGELIKDPVEVAEMPGILGFCDLTPSGRRMADDIGPQIAI